MTGPLDAHLDLNFNNSCNCLCFRTEKSVPIYLDEDMKPTKFCKSKHGEEHIELTYKRIEKLIHQEFDSASIDNNIVVQRVEKISEISLTQNQSEKQPIRHHQLKKILQAIEQLRKEVM